MAHISDASVALAIARCLTSKMKRVPHFSRFLREVGRDADSFAYYIYKLITIFVTP